MLTFFCEQRSASSTAAASTRPGRLERSSRGCLSSPSYCHKEGARWSLGSSVCPLPPERLAPRGYCMLFTWLPWRGEREEKLKGRVNNQMVFPWAYLLRVYFKNLFCPMEEGREEAAFWKQLLEETLSRRMYLKCDPDLLCASHFAGKCFYLLQIHRF